LAQLRGVVLVYPVSRLLTELLEGIGGIHIIIVLY